MGIYGLVAVGSGATLGAWLRWWLSHRMNGIFPAIPMGTLAANLVGGFLVGLAIGLFEKYPGIAPEIRLLVVVARALSAS